MGTAPACAADFPPIMALMGLVEAVVFHLDGVIVESRPGSSTGRDVALLISSRRCR
jgi:hypothetical protein